MVLFREMVVEEEVDIESLHLITCALAGLAQQLGTHMARARSICWAVDIIAICCWAAVQYPHRPNGSTCVGNGSAPPCAASIAQTGLRGTR